MKKLIITTILTGIMMLSEKTMSQVDPHFSQYYAYPLWLNPALTGVIDGDLRVNLNYRNQWNNITSPFSTAGFSVEGATSKNLNLGVNILNQSAGDAGYNYFNGYASLAYTGVKFGEEQMSRLVFGVQAGVLNRKFDPSKFQWGSQYSPIAGYDPNASSNEILTRTSSMVFDANFGVLFYDANPAHRVNVFVGGSAAHLTQPEDPFVQGSGNKLPIRYTGHAGARISVSEMVSITPNVLYMKQRTAEEKMFGAYSQIMINETSDFMLGFNYRIKDAVVPYVGFHYDALTLGLSYDANTSNLNRLTSGSNAFEISLSYTSRKKRVLPREYFICPRL